MGFTSAYGAGDGADMLTQILQQKIAQANADRQFALAQQKAQQDAQESASRIALQREGLASSIDQRGQQADSARTTQALAVGNATPVGTVLDPDALKVLQAGHQGSNITADQTLASRNLSGAAGGPITSTDNPGRLTGQMRWAGTAGQQDKAQKDAQIAAFLANPNLSDEARLAIQFEGMTGKNAPGALVKPPAASRLMNVPPGGVVLDPDTQQPVYTAPNRPQAVPLITVQTVDASGNPVTKVVPKTAGSEFARAPTGAMQGKAEDRKRAMAGLGQLDDAINKAQDFIGPGAGRVSSIEQMVGNPDPRVQALGTKMLMAKMTIDAGIGGARAAASPQLLQRWDNLFSQKLTPEALRATVQAMREMLQAGDTPAGTMPAAGGSGFKVVEIK